MANSLENISYDTINPYLRIADLNSLDLWRNVTEKIVTDKEGYLIFNDTVINNKFYDKIKIFPRQYSRKEHQVIRGIGVVNYVYFYHSVNSLGYEIIEFMIQILTKKLK
ncbi:MAG: hypothetical protein O4861_14770 [Trichodesmium sp. St16_bin4-tuft]|nr:hypothetical protein [Trichodesmium sp. MAG_R01]MDE5099521.1 hypothetical protein [Trichodesmium sp. St16_bin4-tuft]